MGAALEGSTHFIESDLSVGADADNQQVQSPGPFVKLGAIFRYLGLRDGSVGNENIFFLDVYQF